MRPWLRLGLYGALLLVIFGAAFAAGDAFVPDDAVQRWQDTGDRTETPGDGTHDEPEEHGHDDRE